MNGIVAKLGLTRKKDEKPSFLGAMLSRLLCRHSVCAVTPRKHVLSQTLGPHSLHASMLSRCFRKCGGLSNEPRKHGTRNLLLPLALAFLGTSLLQIPSSAHAQSPAAES